MLVQETSKTLRRSTLSSSSSSNPHGELIMGQQDNEMNHHFSDDLNRVSPINSYQNTFDNDGLIIPKRVACPSGVQPIIRDLHRELKFNQTMGRSVLDQKSELKKALEKREDNRKKKQIEQDRLNRRTSLELRLEERAERLAKETESSLSNDEYISKPKTGGDVAPSSSPEIGQQSSKQTPRNEFLEIHAKLCQHASDINQRVTERTRYVKQDGSQFPIQEPSNFNGTLAKNRMNSWL